VIAVDTNVLVYAHREEMPEHRKALASLRRLAESDVPWGIPVFCLGEFLRVVTHPRLLDPPSSLDQALGTLDALLEAPGLRLLSPREKFPAFLSEAMREADARGNLAFDAQIAAVCREHGVDRLLTYDRDFKRFPRLEVVQPG
jgi:toxin-antitoxin system PIN domain toxin